MNHSLSSSCFIHEGMTKRAYIAALAMQGMLSYGFHSDEYGPQCWEIETIPRKAVEMADALLIALNEQDKQSENLPPEDSL